ncbi:hypothetical protein LTR62_008265 [Meristemomyces frigidus]|uniref:Proline dehydrogenase n=1 Tax=Meristemomyces frigidus TaxID=1508187 RepID=A0AAN7TI88_9PEZI|nr:hypothetical protein LTR62_008265 [Meristemomyces frigidus]
MSSLFQPAPLLRCTAGLRSRGLVPVAQHFQRHASTSPAGILVATGDSRTSTSAPVSRPAEELPSGLERLPTSSVIRNILLGYFFSKPYLLKPGFAILRRIADSRLQILNPDVNPILRRALRPLLYDQFCAGTNKAEIGRTKDAIKGIGYSGIILCYGKETQFSEGLRNANVSTAGHDSQITQWRDGNLETLGMIGEGDWLGIKLTGAGSNVTAALMQNRAPCKEFLEATDAVCRKAAAQNCRIWIDAEQQALQSTIDLWTIQLMQRWNTNGKALVYNTVQAYLKASRTKLKHQLALAQAGGWALGIKLVRGAYIGTDPRHLLHDTKQDTDDSYNSIVRDLLSGSNLGMREQDFPKNVRLFLAGHNPDSVSAAWNLVQTLNEEGRLKVVPDFGQLQGMGDVLGCTFLQRRESLASEAATGKDIIVPRLYKCLTWGSLHECMQYLFRRAVENSGGVDRMRDGMVAYKAELRRRLFGSRSGA